MKCEDCKFIIKSKSKNGCYTIDRSDRRCKHKAVINGYCKIHNKLYMLQNINKGR